MASKTCQRAHNGNVCGKPATHALVANGADTNIRMCGEDAREAVGEAMAQGDRSLTAVKVADLAHWTRTSR